MLRKIFLFSFLLGVAFAANSANQYVDNVLQSSLQQELRAEGLLPTQIPDFSVVLDPSQTGRNLVNVDFTFGNITGLENIRRKADCSGPRNYRGEISINCTLSLYPMLAAHRMVVRNATYAVVGKAQIPLTEVKIDLQVVGRPQNYLGVLQRFDVITLDAFNPVFSNLPAYLNGNRPQLEYYYRMHVLNNLNPNLGGIFGQRYANAVRRAFAFKPMPRQ